jgi:hypothetical protein
VSAESEAYLLNERGEVQANVTDFTDAGKRWTSLASSVTLYAVWESKKYTVKYDSSSASLGSNAVIEDPKHYADASVGGADVAGNELTVPTLAQLFPGGSDTIPRRLGYEFRGFSVYDKTGAKLHDNKIYKAGETLKVDADLTLLPKWELKTPVEIDIQKTELLPAHAVEITVDGATWSIVIGPRAARETYNPSTPPVVKNADPQTPAVVKIHGTSTAPLDLMLDGAALQNFEVDEAAVELTLENISLVTDTKLVGAANLQVGKFELKHMQLMQSRLLKMRLVRCSRSKLMPENLQLEVSVV